MSNMSYCMFQNTLKDLIQVQEEGDWDSNELSEEEQEARKDLLNLCREISQCQFQWEEE